MTHKYTNLCHFVQMRDGLFYAKHAHSLTITLKRASEGQTADTDLQKKYSVGHRTVLGKQAMKPYICKNSKDMLL